MMGGRNFVLPILSILFAFIFSVSTTNLPQSGIQEKRREELNENYIVEWQANFNTETIEFFVQAKTTGFVGFGLSLNGQMTGADIFIGGVNSDGSHYFYDMVGVTNGMPVMDSEINWELLGANETAGITSLHFKRALETCDSLSDVQITTGTVKIIWSIGETDELLYHGNNRGALAVNILDPALPPIELSTFEMSNLTMELPLDGVETRYWYTVQKRSSVAVSYIVAAKPILETADALKHTHHFNIYFCKAPEGEIEDQFFSKWLDKPPALSHGEDTAFPYCTTSLYAWSFGGRILIFPENIGFPWGFKETEYFLFEVHVNNPGLTNGPPFETGVTFYTTDVKREKEAGLLTVAAATNSALLIPYKTQDWTLVGHCSSECTKEHLPPTGIYLMNMNLHAHLSGRKMRLRHFRGNKELSWVAKDDTYDFDYQENRPMNEEIHLLPGDHLSIECTYDSNWKNNAVVGGPASTDEMCMVFLFYHPRAPLEGCFSTYPLEQLFERFEIEKVERRPDFEVVVIEPEHLAGSTFTQILNNTEWTTESKNALGKELRYGKHQAICAKDDSKPIYKINFDIGITLVPGDLANLTTYPDINELYEEPSLCGSAGHRESISFFVLLFTIIYNALTPIFH